MHSYDVLLNINISLRENSINPLKEMFYFVNESYFCVIYCFNFALVEKKSNQAKSL